MSDRSEELFARAREVMPGGVNSPVRAFGAVGGVPRFMVRGSGPYLTDVDGRQYVDLVCSWGPMILGHAHPAVLEADPPGLPRGPRLDGLSVWSSRTHGWLELGFDRAYFDHALARTGWRGDRIRLRAAEGEPDVIVARRLHEG